MKTFSAKAHEVKREWFVIDATDKVLGRVASEVALRLRGKHKPEFTPHVEKAVKGMLPKGPLGYAMIKKLKVYADGNHPHAAQQPKALEL